MAVINAPNFARCSNPNGVTCTAASSTEVEFRPEFTCCRPPDANAFNGNFNATPIILPSKNFAAVGVIDLTLFGVMPALAAGIVSRAKAALQNGTGDSRDFAHDRSGSR